MENQDENDQLLKEQIIFEEQQEAEKKAEELREKQHRINNRWCDYMAWIFEKYRDQFEKTVINIPEKTTEIFKNNGVNVAGISQDDIYDSFDNMIRNEQHIEDYLSKQRGKYSVNMPF